MRTVVILSVLSIAWGCHGSENIFKEYASSRSGGTVDMELIPPLLKSCGANPRPVVTWLPVPEAPVRGTIIRAYHVCLGAYSALVRLRGHDPAPIVQVTLEQEFLDIRGIRAPRRKLLRVTRPFGPKTVRYLRLRWREGLTNPGERRLRLRLKTVDYADGKRWTAPPWAPSPRVAAPPDPGAHTIHGSVTRLRGGIQAVTRSLKKTRVKLKRATYRQPEGVSASRARDK